MGREMTSGCQCGRVRHQVMVVGGLDDPTAFTSIEHPGAEAIMEHWLDTRALRRERTGEAPHIAKRWTEVTGRVPD